LWEFNSSISLPELEVLGFGDAAFEMDVSESEIVLDLNGEVLVFLEILQHLLCAMIR